MGTKELLELRRNEILELAAKHGVKNIRIPWNSHYDWYRKRGQVTEVKRLTISAG